MALRTVIQYSANITIPVATVAGSDIRCSGLSSLILMLVVEQGLQAHFKSKHFLLRLEPSPVQQQFVRVSLLFLIPSLRLRMRTLYLGYTGTGATITGTTNNVSVTFASNATGDLSVTGNNSCGNGTVSANYAIAVNLLPAAAGNHNRCSNSLSGVNLAFSYSVPTPRIRLPIFGYIPRSQ
jgi:hypothetical protein